MKRKMPALLTMADKRVVGAWLWGDPGYSSVFQICDFLIKTYLGIAFNFPTKKTNH